MTQPEMPEPEGKQPPFQPPAQPFNPSGAYGQQQPPQGAPMYGQPGGPGQPGPANYGNPGQPSPFGAIFSNDFSKKFTPFIAKFVMTLVIIFAAYIAMYSFFDFLAIVTADYRPGGMGIFTAVLKVGLDFVKALVILGFGRLAIEYFLKNSKDA